MKAGWHLTCLRRTNAKFWPNSKPKLASKTKTKPKRKQDSRQVINYEQLPNDF